MSSEKKNITFNFDQSFDKCGKQGFIGIMDLTQDNQFVGFNGGHMDLAILSFVQFDQLGNINVSVLGEEYFGCGGYIDICHGVKKIIFVGSFTAKNLTTNIKKNNLEISNEGKIKKAVKYVDEITFSPKMQHKNSQEILIITERCVFKIEDNKVILIEISNGINIKKDILNQMDFVPIIDKKLT